MNTFIFIVLVPSPMLRMLNELEDDPWSQKNWRKYISSSLHNVTSILSYQIC